MPQTGGRPDVMPRRYAHTVGWTPPSAMPRTTAPHGPPAKRRILIVDDHPLLRRGLGALIDNEPDLMVCAAATTSREGLAAIATSRPDMVVHPHAALTPTPNANTERASRPSCPRTRSASVPSRKEVGWRWSEG